MNSKLLQTERGQDYLVYKGHGYHKTNVNDDYITYYCAKRKQFNCKARVKYYSPDKIEFPEDNVQHNHPPMPDDIDAKDLKIKMKLAAKDPHQVAPARQIIRSVIKDASVSAIKKLPEITIVRKEICRWKADNPHSNPKTVNEIMLDENVWTTARGNNFIFHQDPQTSDNRMIIFTTDDNLRVLKSCATWYVDGTCKSVPLYEQLWTICGLYKDTYCIPLVFCLMVHKTQANYETILNRLNLPPPNKVVSDFEIPVIKAFESYYGEANFKHQGCYTHFSHAIWHHVDTLGLTEAYTNDEDFRRDVKHLQFLPFVPVDNVIGVYIEIYNHMSTNFAYDGVQELLSYMDSTWIGPIDRRWGRNDPRVRRPGRYALSLWNVYDAAVTDTDHTNNQIEAWHMRWNLCLKGGSGYYYSFYTFLEALVEEQGMSEALMAQIDAGKKPPKPQKSIIKKANIKKICLDYVKHPVYGDYLDSLIACENI